MAEIKTEPAAGIGGKDRRDGDNDEREIIASLDKARNGDREAFKVIVRTYQQKIFALAYSMLGNRDDALDAVQETFLRVYERSGLFKPGNDFGAWLAKVARNVCIDYYRRHRKRKEEWETGQSIDDLPLKAGEDGPDSPGRDIQRILSHLLDRLAARQKKVFIMRHYEELQFNEISRLLNISEGTAKSLHFKAVRNLKKGLVPFLGETS